MSNLERRMADLAANENNYQPIRDYLSRLRWDGTERNRFCLRRFLGAGKSTFFRLLAVKDEWFSDNLRMLDDDNVYRKLQGHWITGKSTTSCTTA